MTANATIRVVSDSASPRMQLLQGWLAARPYRAKALSRCLELTKQHLNGLPHNRMGWPPTNFYQKAARGTRGAMIEDGFRISVDNSDAPGAIRFKYNGGRHGYVTIRMKDKLLTIPAGPGFYGQKATDFDNLRFVPFASGARALVVGSGGTGRVNFATGKSMAVKGGGPKFKGQVAYWLKEQVVQQAMPEVIPSKAAYRRVVVEAVQEELKKNFPTAGKEMGAALK